MKEELQKKLKEEHPEIFKMLYFDEEDMPEEYLDEDSNAEPMLAIEMFGIECGDGWYDLIDTLCETIEMYFQSDNKDKIKSHNDTEDIREGFHDQTSMILKNQYIPS